jgi:hypothetical protein
MSISMSGKRSTKCGNTGSSSKRGGVARDIDADAPGWRVAKSIQAFDGLTNLVERRADGGLKLLAGRCEGDAAVGPVEQAKPEAFLKSLEGVAERRGVTPTWSPARLKLRCFAIARKYAKSAKSDRLNCISESLRAPHLLATLVKAGCERPLSAPVLPSGAYRKQTSRLGPDCGRVDPAVTDIGQAGVPAQEAG